MDNTLTAHDLGNNESYVVGIDGPDADGKYLALTAIESATFKTHRGAVAWLARRGYKANGARMAR